MQATGVTGVRCVTHDRGLRTFQSTESMGLHFYDKDGTRPNLLHCVLSIHQSCPINLEYYSAPGTRQIINY